MIDLLHDPSSRPNPKRSQMKRAEKKRPAQVWQTKKKKNEINKKKMLNKLKQRGLFT